MSISSMIILTALILSASGIGSDTLKAVGINKKSILFFLISLIALKSFPVAVGDDVSVSASSILISVWLFGNAFRREKSFGSQLIIPLSVFVSLILLPVSGIDIIISVSAAAAVPVAFGILFGLDLALGIAGVVPPVFLLARYMYDLFQYGFGTFEFNETCLAMQLSEIMLTVFAALIKSHIMHIKSIRPYSKSDTAV